MRPKALFLILALFFQTTLAHAPSPTQEVSSSSSYFWIPAGIMAGSAVVLSYLLGDRFKRGAQNVMPALLGSSIGIGAIAMGFVLHKLQQPAFSMLLPGLLMVSVLVYKSMVVCPQKGTQGCTCGLNQ
ncbi:MAG: hypothetical protein V4534_01755 [Myxococcota bacterium]